MASWKYTRNAPTRPSPLLHPPANRPPSGGVDGAPPLAENADLARRSNGSTAMGAASPSDPFALSFGGFRRLMLPRGAKACSKGHSLFYGQGLGAPPLALRKVSSRLLLI